MRHFRFLASGLMMACLPAAISYATMMSGADVAASLNQRYENVALDCDGNPTYYCSGILIRTNEKPGVPTWEPYTEGYLDSLQFSYLREDIGVDDSTIFGYDSTGFGIFILRDDKSPGTRCIFPMNATSVNRGQYGCGDLKSVDAVKDTDADNSNCIAEGIVTAEQWKKCPLDKQCSFSTHDPRQFSEAVKASTEFINNEMIINVSKQYWSLSDLKKIYRLYGITPM